ncbi:acyl-CoA--sterol O-acyltransferase 1-like [Neltuma alba]|uniref:acyl-CoA--sterol O-acyltransferase 1-like n=1 Tax=Neltuma alba TaxID=207710 RepID=UPI0010A2D31F|nr:acyl-CoA--sterol O-acyltransferase 1-like [Prosopis alba]XP_028797792.1 acyl-CoA--sterol O-acyltransferase 1-like [Prosopis alba]
MDGVNEIMKLGKVWFTVCISLCYCYWIGKIVPKGSIRLICVLPIIFLFFFLPLSISSVHFSGITGFFVSWLANFKLLLFAFAKGPLSSDHSSFISLGRFVLLACLPIKMIPQHKSKISQIRSKLASKLSKQSGINENLNPQEPKISQTETYPNSTIARKSYITPLQYPIKAILVAIMVKIYDYSDLIHPNFILGLYALHIYFLLELSLAVAAAMARAVLGMELEPQFNNPFLSSSLQDFWSRRWNLMVTRILRPTVYEPTLDVVTRIAGPKWAPLPAVMGTFVVSGVMHELMMYYIGRVKPSFRMTWFFLLHGLCLMVEIALKKAVNGRWLLPRAVSGPLTVVFVMSTSFWLFLPEFVRCKVDVRAFEEYAALGAFVKNASHAFPL